MQQLADDVWQIPLVPRQGVNAYVIGDVLIDAGLPIHAKKILGELQGRAISAHALTHVHNDHAGGSKRVSETLGIPVWVGADDAGALRRGRADVAPGRRGGSLMARLRWVAEGGACAGAARGRRGRRLRRARHARPQPGHISFWRESDRTLVCGDVFFNMNVFTTAPGLRQPSTCSRSTSRRTRTSERRLAELEPALTLFGHGPPLRDPSRCARWSRASPPEREPDARRPPRARPSADRVRVSSAPRTSSCSSTSSMSSRSPSSPICCSES